MKIQLSIILAVGSITASTILNFDSYKGIELTAAEYNNYVESNTTYYCVQSLSLPCDETAWRTLDGSCNYLKNPSRGAGKTPFYRILPSKYTLTASGYEDRLATDGSLLELPRAIRTKNLATEETTDKEITVLAINYLTAIVSDLTDLHDTVDYIQQVTYCCTTEGAADPRCAPNIVPDDDPVFRDTDIRCLNLTKPISFQLSGCLSSKVPPERVTTATPFMDMAPIYGDSITTLKSVRTLSDGKLVTDVDNRGRIWPPRTTGENFCLQNQGNETRCHAVPNQVLNSLININLIGIWYWRQHNMIATKLAKYNPSWDDDRLFETARDINIAINNQIIFYELLPLIFGKENMIDAGLIGNNSKKFRDIYDDSVVPQIAIEYSASMRWGHIVQQGFVKLMDSDGNTYKNISSTELTLRTGYLDQDNNIEGLTQGCWRQESGRIGDNILDPQIGQFGFGKLQEAADLSTSDLHKHRLLGLQPYVKYLEFCKDKPFTTFKSLEEFIEPARIKTLMEVYKDVNDIDLMAGLWLEKPIKGGVAPFTLFCIAAEQLNRVIVQDRHWYERKHRPHAFTLKQLHEIRKASMARLLCDNADSITHITEHPFLRMSKSNPLVSCSDINKVSFEPWKES